MAKVASNHGHQKATWGKNYGYQKTAQKKLATDIKKLQGKKITLKTSLKSIVEKKVWSGRSL